jgi:hypothetical protein
MKFVKNNKELGDSNAENRQENQENFLVWFLCVTLRLCGSAALREPIFLQRTSGLIA